MIRNELKKEPWTGQAGSKQWRSRYPRSVRSAAAGTSGGSVPSRLCPPGSDTWTSFLSFYTPYKGSFDPVCIIFLSNRKTLPVWASPWILSQSQTFSQQIRAGSLQKRKTRDGPVSALRASGYPWSKIRSL